MSSSPVRTVGGDLEDNVETLTGDEVVISGISGIFPSSDNVRQFMDNLYQKVDMVSSDDRQSSIKHPEMPRYWGKIDGLNKFDAQFFRVTRWQADSLDPLNRKLMEHTFSAIFDSGTNPLTLSGSKLGIFVGSSSDYFVMKVYNILRRNNFIHSGCSKAMVPNRNSYWIDAKGPSYAIDVASASSMACLETAYNRIKSGECDAAIVGGGNTCTHPTLFFNLRRAGLLCLDGKNKCFDKKGDGYVRSEAINVFFLQKAKDAKRIYAEVYYPKGYFFMRPDALFLPTRESKDIQKFMAEIYSETNISPNEVEYIEAYGSGLAEADGHELEAIGQLFGKEYPVKVGSVNSNMGNSEAAAGVCAVTKVCLAYHTGKLPGNLHYYEPQDHIPAVRDGQVQILTENTPFNRGFTAINSFSYTGPSYHVLLKGHYIAKKKDRYKSSIPYLVLISGRQEESVIKVLDTLKNRPIDVEQIALLHNIYQHNIPGHTGRGYTVLATNTNSETISLAKNFEYYTGQRRPVCFLYSGMGSQWPAMGAKLMNISIFADAIDRCQRALASKGIDLVKVITDPDICNNILGVFVGITAIQIGLTDVLKAMEIFPDNIIGYSMGEIGCSYADGSTTLEETILLSYYRGLSSVRTKYISGSMAAVGLGYKDILPLCPPEIDIACYNSPESCTISGPAEAMKQFVADLTSRGIFAKEVSCFNIAYHSRYIKHGGSLLLSSFKEIIKQPKLRSDKWLSTAVPQDKWDAAKYASAEYFTDNAMNPVYFEKAARMIPHNAIVIEIAPHGLLQAIMKGSHKECIHITLSRRGHTDPVKFFLEAVGKLYVAGLNPKLGMLYPKVEFPVSTETPILSDLVEWEHNHDWHQEIRHTQIKVTMAAIDFVISIHDDDYKYFEGNIIDGVNVFPDAALLVLVWETLAMYMCLNYQELSVVFENVKFHNDVIILPEDPVKLRIMILKGSRRFEVTNEGSQVMSGSIRANVDSSCKEKRLTNMVGNLKLNSYDIYELLELRGFSYSNEFQSIHSTNIPCNKAQIKWTGKWVTFLDSLIQFNVFARDHDGVSRLRYISSLSINIDRHKIENKVVMDGVTLYDAEMSDGMFANTMCGGVRMHTPIFFDKPNVELKCILNQRTFIPHFPVEIMDFHTTLLVNLQIVAENATKNEIRVTELNVTNDTFVMNYLKDVANVMSSNNVPINTVKLVSDINFINYEAMHDCNMLVLHNVIQDKKRLQYFCNIIKETFILCVESDNKVVINSNKINDFDIITCISTEKFKLILLKKGNAYHRKNCTFIKVDPDTFSWISHLETETKKNKHVILVQDKQQYCGIENFVRAFKKDKSRSVGLLVVEEDGSPAFNPNINFYIEQLNKNLTFNIFKQRQWGGYYYLPVITCTEFKNVKMFRSGTSKFDDLEWTEDPEPPRSKTLVQICYSGLSLKDCQQVAGNVINRQQSFGMDFSGFNMRSERVMGLVSSSALGSTVEADPDLLWPVPNHWSLQDAATVPLPYIHAYYCLTMKGQLFRGQTVFVTGGAGALGQAVISLCLALDCTVYTIVSNIEKKNFLLRMFPTLNEDHIGYSRHPDFCNMVIFKSKNRRCDFVINCCSGTLREAAMKCVGFTGFFLDISNHDMKVNNDIGMSCIDGDRTYKFIDISNIFKQENIKEKKILQQIVSEGIAKGVVRPLSRVIYSPKDISRAFRLLCLSEHRGRVLVNMKDLESLSQRNVKQRISISPQAAYCVVCDESGLGIELVDRLVERGAMKFMLRIKSNFRGCYFQLKLSSWKKSNVMIRITSDNLQEIEECENLLEAASALGPVEGIFIIQNKHKKDAINENEFKNSCNETFVQETAVVANLDLVSRKKCYQLSYFAVTAVAPKNIADEYAYGISERICEARNRLGLPALILRTETSHQYICNTNNQQQNLNMQTIKNIISALETSLKLKCNNIMVQNSPKKSFHYLQGIEKCSGIANIYENDDEGSTLNDFELNEINNEPIRTVVKESDQINQHTKDLKKLSILSIKQLESRAGKHRTKFRSGLGAFFSYIEEDQYMATQLIVPMKTQLSNANEKDDELAPEATYLMMIPGFEGNHRIFISLSEILKIRAVTVQLDPDSKEDSIQAMAINILNHIKSNFQLKSKFYLMGYSFGVNVALELAALLETEGHLGIVYCLDSSPAALRVHLNAYLGDLDDEEMQNIILKHIFELTTGKNPKRLEDDLEKNHNWPDKVEAFMLRLRGLTNYSHQYLRSITETAYKRINLAKEYEPTYKLNSELVLIKGISHPKTEGLSGDYNLSKISKRPVKVFEIESDHILTPYNCRVATIVNRLLDPILLREFLTNKFCDYYYVTST